MEKENLENLFNELQGSFDIKEPKEGHEQRFLQKLKLSKDETSEVVQITRTRKSWFKPLSIAASLVILSVLFRKFN